MTYDPRTTTPAMEFDAALFRARQTLGLSGAELASFGQAAQELADRTGTQPWDALDAMTMVANAYEQEESRDGLSDLQRRHVRNRTRMAMLATAGVLVYTLWRRR